VKLLVRENMDFPKVLRKEKVWWSIAAKKYLCLIIKRSGHYLCWGMNTLDELTILSLWIASTINCGRVMPRIKKHEDYFGI